MVLRESVWVDDSFRFIALKPLYYSTQTFVRLHSDECMLALRQRSSRTYSTPKSPAFDHRILGIFTRNLVEPI